MDQVCFGYILLIPSYISLKVITGTYKPILALQHMQLATTPPK